MPVPDDQHWERVEELGRELEGLPADALSAQLSKLAADGESPTVLTLLSSWLSLPPPPPPLGPGGTVAGRYRLVEKLGDGGMGSVWRARQDLIGREVALKMIHPALATPDLRVQFLREMEVLGKLDHPGIVKIFDAGLYQHHEFGEIPFFAMELVDGVTLDEWAAGNRDDRAGLLQIGVELCQALQSAHDRRVVHRDLKPANILVRPDGRPVILDFGIARLAGAAIGDESGSFTGTPRYAAPEQHRGRDLDFRSGEGVDVYSLGVVLFEILTGRRLFDIPRNASMAQIRHIVLEAPMSRLADVLPGCPPYLDEVISKALRRDPMDRYSSITELGRAVARAAALYDTAKPAPQPWKPASHAIVPGTQWRLDRKLGEGSAGEVWLATHGELGHQRVFKFCDSEDKARTLRRELTLNRLLKEHVGRNPHFIELHEVSLDEAPWYLLMDHVEAVDLPTWCAAQPGGLGAVPLETRIELVAQVAEALQDAHEARILHRDIKPANLLVGRAPQGSPTSARGLHVYITDFGIGQIVADEVRGSSTRLGFTRTVSDIPRSGWSGTMMYMAPEVLEGKPATARSDLYSLGVVLWQLLTGSVSTALAPTDWAAKIKDPLLVEDLSKCLASDPENRWNSCKEFAARLRGLPERRACAERQKAEQAAALKAATRRGAALTALAAAALVALFAGLAWLAWQQRGAALQNAAVVSLERASALNRTDFEIGRRDLGRKLLEDAAKGLVPTNIAKLRTAAASILGLPDLEPVTNTSPATSALQPFKDSIPKAPTEKCREFSPDGRWLAVGRDVDGLNGAVDLLDAATGARRLTIQRKLFPWIPIPEPGLLRFSPDGSRLAIGGPDTSRHVVLCDTATGNVQSYIFHGSDPLCVAWHPGGRLLATGCKDHSLRIWDTAAAIVPTNNAPAGNQFDLPPLLDVPALDIPLALLRGHLDAVRFLAFESQGRWLASLDGARHLHIHGGFTREGIADLPVATATNRPSFDLAPPALPLVVEALLEDAGSPVSGLTTLADRVVVSRINGSIHQLRLSLGDLPAETRIGFGLSGVAWKEDASELCAITATDLHWFRREGLEAFCEWKGKNPIGIAWDAGTRTWTAPSADRFRQFATLQEGTVWSGSEVTSTASSNQVFVAVDRNAGAVTAMAAPGDGRIAIYYGRRIQFFAAGKPAPTNSAIVVAETNRIFRQLSWDRTGRLLFAAFGTTNRSLQLEAWSTSTNASPSSRPFVPHLLDAQRIAPANDGVHSVARSEDRGLLSVDHSNNQSARIDDAPWARQDAALAVSPTETSSPVSSTARTSDCSACPAANTLPI